MFSVLKIKVQPNRLAIALAEKKLAKRATELKIPDGIDVTYRYVICRFVKDGKISIQRWETSVDPRKITCHEPCDVESVADFSTEFQRGWLTSESIVQLKLFGDNSLNIWKSKFEGQQLCVKVSSSEDSQNWSVFEVANLNNEGGKLQPQMEGGIVYHETDFILFQAQVLEISSVAFTVEISLSTDDFPGKLIGFCYLMPRHFKSTTGTVKETIISPVSEEPIGEIKIEFLVIHPIKQVSYDFAISFAKYWDPQLNCIDIGHRGLGNSFLTAKTK